MNDETLEVIRRLAAAFAAFAADPEPVENPRTLSEKRAEAGRKGGFAKQANKEATVGKTRLAGSNASPHPTESGGGGGASSFATAKSQLASNSNVANELASKTSQQNDDDDITDWEDIPARVAEARSRLSHPTHRRFNSDLPRGGEDE